MADMFDIVKCEADAKQFGFSRLYQYDTVSKKIISAENLEQATNYRDKDVLIMLKRYEFDVGSIKLIAEKRKACFLIDLGAVIRTNGLRRAIAMARIRTFLRNCVKYGAFYAFASFAEKKEQLRTSDEMIHIAMLFGLNKGQARFALEMLSEYL